MLLPLLTPDEDTSVEDLLEQGLTGTDWVQAGAILLAAIAVAIAANRVARSIVSRSLGAGFGAIITARIIGYLFFLIGLVYALNTLGVRVGPLLGALGLSGLILALALQKVAENFIGALILQTRRPFTVGDTVELSDHVGVVTDVDARTVSLRGLDGSMIRIPNLEVLNSPIVNLTRESVSPTTPTWRTRRACSAKRSPECPGSGTCPNPGCCSGSSVRRASTSRSSTGTRATSSRSWRPPTT